MSYRDTSDEASNGAQSALHEALSNLQAAVDELSTNPDGSTVARVREELEAVRQWVETPGPLGENPGE